MAGSETSSDRIKDVAIRLLENHDDYRATIEAQRRIWGFSDGDCVPPRLMIVADEIGGLALGAFSDGKMIGFSLAFPGRAKADRTGRRQTFWHSHMTGVLPAWQGRGIGRRIKIRQREEALRSGIEVVEWTFDPLEIRNAYFNIERLGVLVRRYLPNQYGVTSSRLHGGLPTDRLVAEWWVRSERASSAVERASRERPKAARTIEAPLQIADLRASDRTAARKVQARVREQFEAAFAEGLTVVGFRLEGKAGVYELGRLAEQRGVTE